MDDYELDCSDDQIKATIGSVIALGFAPLIVALEALWRWMF